MAKPPQSDISPIRTFAGRTVKRPNAFQSEDQSGSSEDESALSLTQWRKFHSGCERENGLPRPFFAKRLLMALSRGVFDQVRGGWSTGAKENFENGAD